MQRLLPLSPLFGCLAAVLALVGCGDPSSTSSKPAGGEPGFTISVIPKGTTHEFWKSIHAGAVKAERELNDQGVDVTITWNGPLKEDDRDKQIQEVENAISRRVDGIVLAPLDDKALVRPVETAMDNGIPVVIIDSGLSTTNYVSFVATDNFRGGEIAGEHLGTLMNGEGNVILLRYQVGSASTDKREEGFLKAIRERHPGIKIISSDQYAGATRETAYQASQNLLSRFRGEVNGVFCPCEPVTIAMTKALRDLELAGGKVKIVGFDAGSQSVLDLKKGDLQGLVLQHPVNMGYLGVLRIVDHLNQKSVDRRIDTGVVLVTADNMMEPAMQELLNPPLDRYLKDR